VEYREINFRLITVLNSMQSDKLQGEIASLNGKVQDLMTENLTFQERLKVFPDSTQTYNFLVF